VFAFSVMPKADYNGWKQRWRRYARRDQMRPSALKRRHDGNKLEA